MPEDPIDEMAAAYFAPPIGGFWRWDDRAETLVWQDGTTIVFRSELPALLAPIQAMGLPASFTAIVLVLAATRPSWQEAAESQLRPLKDAVADRIAQTDVKPLFALGKALGVLSDVARLPPQRRESTAAKSTVLQVTLQRQLAPLARAHSAALLESLARRVPARALVAKERDALVDLTAACEAIVGTAIDAERLALIQATGFDELPKSADVELRPESIKALLAMSGRDGEIGAVTRIAMALMPATSLPRPLAAPEDLHVGGVSDVSNRGPLHRLLLSELVHDDLTLMARVALSEALYLRRESPPQASSIIRSMLIDSGIRSWGVARVFGTAAALALAAQAPRHARVRAWRANRDRIEQVDLGSRHGLIAHLGTLASEPHPGAAIAAWIASDREESVERILILTPAAFEDPYLRRELDQLRRSLFVVTVDSGGLFRLRSLPAGTSLREARLDLSELMSTSAAESLRVRAEHLPRIYDLRPFPLLLPTMIHQQRSCTDLDGKILSVTLDGRLLHWQASRHGGAQLADDVPPGKVLWIGPTRNGAVQVVVGNPPSLRFVLIQPFHGVSVHATLHVPRTAVKSVSQQCEDIVVICADQTHVFSGETGRPRGMFPHPDGARWRRGRFFCTPSGWYAISWDGSELRHEEVCRAAPGDPHGHWDIDFFDRIGLDNPWGFTSKGEVVSMSDGSEISILPPVGPFTLINISQDGHRLLVDSAEKGGGRRFLLDLKQKRFEKYRSSSPLEPQYHDCVRGMKQQIGSLLGDHRIHGVYREDGLLCMFTEKRQVLTVTVADGIGLVISPAPSAKPNIAPANMLRLVDYPEPHGDHRKLLSAVSGRTRVLVDGRGLLHLMPLGDFDAAEISFTLNIGGTAGWSSSGSLWGPPLFLGDVPASLSAHLEDHLRRHLDELPT